MKAAVKNITSDIFDLKTYCPDNLRNFSISLRVQIGLDCTLGADDFEIFICTPEWLIDNIYNPYWGRGLLLIREYNLQEVYKNIHELVDGIEGESWQEISTKLSKFFYGNLMIINIKDALMF
ncbi:MULTISPECIES: Imm8 family immunity protein [Delftia]|jgi:hypothetical protein|nr:MULTISPECIES: Imm8 family immunity protein [Delftia]